MRPLPAGQTGGFVVLDAIDLVAPVDQAGHAGQRAETTVRPVPESPAFDRAPGHPDRQLMADQHDFVSRGFVAGIRNGRVHPPRDFGVWLTPRGTERVAQLHPMTGPQQRTVTDTEGQPFKDVPWLDQSLIRLDRQVELRRNDLGSLDGTVQWGRAHEHDIATAE